MRDQSIDFLKGIAIVLMVIGHAVTNWAEGKWILSFIGLFHMPVFFMAAGYVFNAERVVGWLGLKAQILKRCKRLWLVYFLSVSGAVLLTNVFIACNVYTDNPAIKEYLHGALIGTHQLLGWKEMCKHILLTVPMINRQELVVALWFLKSLFVLSVGYCIVEHLLRKISSRPIIWQSVIAVVCLLFSWYHPWWWTGKVLFVLGGAQTFSGYALFHLGRIIREKGWKSEKGSLAVGFAALGGLVLLCCFKCALHDSSLAFCFFLPTFILGAILGWIMLVNFGACSGGFAFLGQHTMPILVLHFLSFKLVNYLGVLYYGHPAFCAAGFPASYHGWGWTLLYTIAGVGLPVSVSLIYGKITNKIIRTT